MGGWLFVKFVCKLSGVCAGLCDPAKLYRKKKILVNARQGKNLSRTSIVIHIFSLTLRDG